MNRHVVILPFLAGIAMPDAQAQQLSPQDVFKQVSPSVVVIEVRDFPKGKPSRVVASGSGVVVPSRKQDETLIATNCHLTDKSPAGVFLVKQGDSSGLGILHGRDSGRDLCLVTALFPDGRFDKDKNATFKKLSAVRIASSQWLEVGDPVYAIGAPQGLELTLSDGLVSGIREYKSTEYIQTTAPISPGSSGGGLFDAQGRLVGITTMFLKEGQALNFAVPAELIASVPEVERRGEGESAPAVDAQAAADAAATATDSAADAELENPRDRWLLIGESRDGVKSYIDTQTVQRTGVDVTVWIKFKLIKPEAGKSGGAYDEMMLLETQHCGSRQSTTRSSSRSLRGSPVYSRDYKSYEMERENIRPGTTGEAIYQEACRL